MGCGYNPPYDSMNSPSKHKHVSQPFTQKSKDDVYDRLYNNSDSAIEPKQEPRLPEA